MGCHIIDHPVWALQLDAPETVEARHTIEGSLISRRGDSGRVLNLETYPKASMVTYRFGARPAMPPVTLTWYDGGLMPPTPPEMDEGSSLPSNGVLYVGSQGKMYHGSHGGMPQLLPQELLQQAQQVPQSIPRSRGHYEEWLDACRGEGKTFSHFGYAGPMTETVLLGVLALRAPGRRLQWDSRKLQVKNAPELNQYVHKEYRTGWSL